MLSPRGQRTVKVTCTLGQATSLVNEVPGLVYSPDNDGVLAPWWDVPMLAKRLGKPVPQLPEDPIDRLPGGSRYRQLLSELPNTPRPYQEEDAVWLANRPAAMLCLPMRAGKSLVALLGSVLADAKRILVLCPSISRWVWGDEANKWLGIEPVILEGLSRSRALQYCGTCKQSGRLPDGRRCPACKQRNGSTYGYQIHEVRSTEPPGKRALAKGVERWACRRHQTFQTDPEVVERCPRCKEAMAEVLFNERMLISNFEILRGKGFTDPVTRRVTMRDDMRGWSDLLSMLKFDLVIIDESHYLRGFDTSFRRQGKMMYDLVASIVDQVPMVWLLTGTPVYGLTRDLYGQLHVATGGLIGDPIHWTTRYCAGAQGEFGWVSTGRSNEEELKERLDTLMVIRPRSEILKYMPPKQRRVVYLETEKNVRRRTNGSAVGTVAKLIDAIAPVKHDTVIENVLSELAEGLKVYVLTFRPKHAERLHKLLTKKMNTRQWRARMNAVKAETWLGQTEAGITAKRRKMLADSFCEHKGAAVFVATIRSMPGSISLKGVTSVHMVDFDTSPASMEQAEDRGYEPGTTGYSITHYVVKNSVDDDLAAVVIPKFRTKDELLQDENAKNVLNAFDEKAEELVMSEVLKRHLAHLEDDDDEEDED